MSHFAPDPLEIKNPAFKCRAPHEYFLEADVAISDPKSGNKYERYSTLSFRTDNMSGYGMDIAIRLQNKEKEWFLQEDCGAITIRLKGDYEADTLREFFQHVGIMATVTYGKLTYQDDEGDANDE